MNNGRSPKDQLIFNFLLSFMAVWMIFNYFNAPKTNTVAPRKAPTLVEAWKNIAAGNGESLTPTSAAAEITKQQGFITANSSDEQSMWSRLRIGLIQQYVLGKLEPVTIPGGMFSKSWQGTIYDEVINHHGRDVIYAQALYQKGDMLWRTANGTPSHDAVIAFEAILQQSRADKTFNTKEIFVPIPGGKPGEFAPKTIADVLGHQGSTDPDAVLVRVDSYYQPSGLYRSVDAVVKFCGNQPKFSFGITILLLAICTRICMQPLTRKQYQSMKGMTVIAPEMKKIQEKYKGKTEQAAQMQMMKEIKELQARHGVSPMLGCGLGLLQIPFFFYIVSPAMRHYEAKMELVGASFLWIGNLARPDIVLLVFYGITMFVSFRISSLPPTDEQQRQQQRMMMFMMPMFPFFLLSYPSAFALYWMFFNMTSTVLQFRMMKESDPDKRVIKSILGTPSLMTSGPEVVVVPPRPKDGGAPAKKVKLAPLAEAEGSLNGNGAAVPMKTAGQESSSSNGSSKGARRKRRH